MQSLSNLAQPSTAQSLINILFGAVKRHPKKEREKKKSAKTERTKTFFLPRPRRIINNNFGYLKYKYAQGSVTAEQGGRGVAHMTHTQQVEGGKVLYNFRNMKIENGIMKSFLSNKYQTMCTQSQRCTLHMQMRG